MTSGAAPAVPVPVRPGGFRDEQAIISRTGRAFPKALREAEILISR